MHQSFGKIIKLTRLEKNIKQEDLCEGICTPSYLSRIENNRVIADSQVYELLLNKLGITIKTEQVNIEEIDYQIEQWHEQLLLNQTTFVNIDALREAARCSNDDTYLKFKIVYCRYLLKEKNLSEAKKHIEDIQKSKNRLKRRQQFLFINVQIIFYYWHNQFSKALEHAEKFLELKQLDSFAKPLEIGVFYYNIASIFKNLYHFNKGIYYSNRALNIFKEWFYLNYSLKCHVLLGICYNNSHEWNNALHSYAIAKKILPYLPKCEQATHSIIIENNIGRCYESMGNYQQALHYYLKSYNNEVNTDKIINILNILRCNYKLNNLDQAYYWLQIGLKSTSPDTHKKFIFQLKIFNIVLHNQDFTIDEIKQLESESINFFTSAKMKDYMLFYSELFAQLYKERNLYKKACEMYELALLSYKKGD